MTKSKFLCFLLLSLLIVSQLAVLQFGFVPNVYATTIFSDGFESGDFSAWSGTVVDAGASLSVKANNPHHGVYNAEAQTTQAWTGTYCWKSFTAGAIIHLRSYIKFDTLPSADGRRYELHCLDSGVWSNSVVVIVRNSAGTMQWGLIVFVGGAGTFYYEATPSNPQTGIWYCVEILRDLTNQCARLWVDGVLKVNATGLSQVDNTARARCGITNSNGETVTARIFFDCVVVADAYIGPEAGDTTAPTCSDVDTNTTAAGQPCLFHVLWNDNVNVSGFIFGTNNTGVWVNDTWTSFTVYYNSTAAWSNVTKTLNSTVSIRVEWQIWVNDTSNNWKTTGLQYFITVTFDVRLTHSVSVTLTPTSKTDFALQTANPITVTPVLGTKTDFILNIPQSITNTLSTALQTTFNLSPQTSMSISLTQLGKADFIITTTNPISTSWILDVVHTISWGIQYIVDLSTSITMSFETFKQWFANIIITAQPSATLTQTTKTDFTIIFTSPAATGWTLTALIPTPTPEEVLGGWTPARITLFTQIYVAIVDAWRFVWTLETPVSVNVTVVNESPYTSGTMFYQIVNLDTGEIVRDWTVGEPVLINSYANTTLTITTTIPIQRNFETEHFKINVKLSLMTQVIEAESTFTVEKDVVKQFFGNVAVLGLCLGLVAVAVYSYKQKPEPWKKYPTLNGQKRRKYPERKGKS